MSFIPPFHDPLFLQRSLSGYAQAITSLAATFSAAQGTAGLIPPALQASLADGYRRLFAAAVPPAGAPAATPGPAASAPAFVRFQSAAAHWADFMSAIAQDAAERLAAALQQPAPEAPPITDLFTLRALWVDCGEAAYAEAARRDEFAAAQAELLMAAVELSAAS